MRNLTLALFVLAAMLQAASPAYAWPRLCRRCCERVVCTSTTPHSNTSQRAAEPKPVVEEIPEPQPDQILPLRVKVYRDKAGEWRFRILAANNRTLPDGYHNKKDCLDTIELLRKNMASSVVQIEGEK